MPIAKANADSKPLDPVPAGVHQSVCYSIIDLGTQPSNNPQFSPTHKVQVGWEIPGEIIQTEEGPKPRVISKEYTLSLGKKANLRAALESWRGRPFTEEELLGFDLSKLIGVNCLLNVIHVKSPDGTKTYNRVQGIMPLPKGMPVLKPILPVIKFDLPASGPIMLPVDMPDWLKTKITQSAEWTTQMRTEGHAAETKRLEAGADPAITGEVAKEDVPF